MCSIVPLKVKEPLSCHFHAYVLENTRGGPRLIVTAYSPLPSFSKYLSPAVNKTMYYLQNRINVMKTNKYINKTTICYCVHAICFTILYVFGPGEMAMSLFIKAMNKPLCVSVVVSKENNFYDFLFRFPGR